jgi:hypothetical protein
MPLPSGVDVILPALDNVLDNLSTACASPEQAGVTSEGVATTSQWTLATLCGYTREHEVRPHGGGHGLRDSHHSMGWTERDRQAPTAPYLAGFRPS